MIDLILCNTNLFHTWVVKYIQIHCLHLIELYCKMINVQCHFAVGKYFLNSYGNDRS